MDTRMIEALRGQHLLPQHVRVDFAQPVQEPMLWIPDAVAGAVGMARGGQREHPKVMEHTVTEIDVTVRWGLNS